VCKSSLGELFAVQRALGLSRRFDLFRTEVAIVFAQDPARIHGERAWVYRAKKQHVEEVSETNLQLRIEGCVACADRVSGCLNNSLPSDHPNYSSADPFIDDAGLTSEATGSRMFRRISLG
jgi:hypothetical protein